jgi:hypothetical protein
MIPGSNSWGLEEGAIGAHRSEGNPDLVMVCLRVEGTRVEVMCLGCDTQGGITIAPQSLVSVDAQRTTASGQVAIPLSLGNTGGRALPSRPEREPDLSDKGSFQIKGNCIASCA